MTGWLFASVVLSNAYKGILTSDLTAYKPVKGLETFADLGDADLIIQPLQECYKRLNRKSKAPETFVQYFRRLRGVLVSENASIVRLLSTPNDTERPDTHLNVFHDVTFGKSNASESYTKKALSVSQKLVYPVKENTTEKIVLSCDRIAYLDFQSKIKNFKIPIAMRNYLVKHPLVLGKEKIFVSDIGVSIVHDCGLLEFLRIVYESGIFRWVQDRMNALHESRLEWKYWLSVPRGAQQLRFSSNFSQTLFSIYNFLSWICLGIFVTELFVSRIYLI
ncbi:unnamed protein product [Allacma fusca]|uniref:Uncharacterized protein n=1 Tax=Allacma fusca TaxID=39272 RepID=A0A8J2K8P7_9HEXA|nr:unnamed protein product [Allacma fusca]